MVYKPVLGDTNYVDGLDGTGEWLLKVIKENENDDCETDIQPS